MKIAIMGSGGLGGYFGARLAKGGADVTFIARGAHLEAMRDRGLSVEGASEPIHVSPVRASDDPASIGVCDLVVFAVKLWDTEEALELIRPMVGPRTTIVSFQNGVLKDEYLRAAYGASHIMGGVGYVATTIDRPGVIRQTGPMQRLIFGEFDGQRSERAEAFHEACIRGGSMPRSARIYAARSGRNSFSLSGFPEPPPPCARPSARSAPTRRPAPFCSTSCARWSRWGAPMGSPWMRTMPSSA